MPSPASPQHARTAPHRSLHPHRLLRPRRSPQYSRHITRSHCSRICLPRQMPDRQACVKSMNLESMTGLRCFSCRQNGYWQNRTDLHYDNISHISHVSLQTCIQKLSIPRRNCKFPWADPDCCHQYQRVWANVGEKPLQDHSHPLQAGREEDPSTAK